MKWYSYFQPNYFGSCSASRLSRVRKEPHAFRSPHIFGTGIPGALWDSFQCSGRCMFHSLLCNDFSPSFSWITPQFSEDVRRQLSQNLDIVSTIKSLHCLIRIFAIIVSKCIFSQSIIMTHSLIFWIFSFFSKSFLRPVTDLHGVAVTDPSDGKRKFSFWRRNRLIRHLKNLVWAKRGELGEMTKKKRREKKCCC